MKNSQKSFVFLIVIILLLVVAGGVYYLYSKNVATNQLNKVDDFQNIGNNTQMYQSQSKIPTDTQNPLSKEYSYYQYSNPIYSLQLPTGWGVVESQDSLGKILGPIEAFPYPSKHISIETEFRVFPTIKERLIVDTVTPKDNIQLQKTWAIISKYSEALTLANISPNLNQVRLAKGVDSCDTVDTNSKTIEITYIAQSDKRIYTIAGCYENSSDKTNITSYINKIVATLKEK